MTLKPCKACGAQISAKAATCPQCGHPQPKPTSLGTKIIGGFFAFMVLVAVLGSISRGSREPVAPGHSSIDTPGLAPIVPGNAGPPAPSAAETRAKAEQLRAAIAAKTLKNAAKDPDTFELKSAATHPDGSVCYEYRARNSFNAMLKGSAILMPKGNILIEEHDGNNFVRAWNKACTVADGRELVDYVKIMID